MHETLKILREFYRKNALGCVKISSLAISCNKCLNVFFWGKPHRSSAFSQSSKKRYKARSGMLNAKFSVNV
jgi:hypothetical protein